MRTERRWPVAFAVIVMTTLLCLPTGTSEAASPSVLITEVSPSEEGVSIQNLAPGPVDLGGWSLTDGEGTLTFLDGYVLGPGERLTVVAEAGTGWFCSRDRTVTIDGGVFQRSGRFVLADSGDEVSLIAGDSVIDQVCWGKSDGVAGWSGDPAKIGSGMYLLRTSFQDTGTSSDWTATKAGWTNLPFPGMRCFETSVTPFSFPESGGEPVYRALESAEVSVHISIYLISCPNVIALLAELCARGVEVCVMAEASPLGVDVSRELSLLKSLDDSGADVRLINHAGQPHRYSYVHNKYAVIDGGTVVITSENWTSGNMGYGTGNRGWGAVISGTGYAEYMEGIFANDFDTKWGDTEELSVAYPGLKEYGSPLVYEPPDMCQYDTFEATVSPILSPDNSYGTLRSLIGSAGERVYAEEMDVAGTLASAEGDTPLGWLAEAASEGVDVRFVLDASQSDGESHRTVVNLLNGTTGIRAVAVDGGDGFSLIHNKGIVIDDSVWVGSINWTTTSFDRNRETAVLISSYEVSEFFAGLFAEDYGIDAKDVEENGLSLSAEIVESGSGRFIVLRASAPTGSVYHWTLDGETRVTGFPVTVFRISSGDHDVSVSVEGVRYTEYLPVSVPSDVSDGGSVIYLSALGIILLGAAAAIMRRRPRRRSEWRYGG